MTSRDLLKNREAHIRQEEWTSFYLTAARAMHALAEKHRRESDYFSAYLCLWVAFNNVYALISHHQGPEAQRLAKAVRRVSDSTINRLTSDEAYLEEFGRLNERTASQGLVGGNRGVVDMQHFFDGFPVASCIKRVNLPKPTGAATMEERRLFLCEVITKLLYTVRNNLFHAVKGPSDPADQSVVKSAFKLLDPVFEDLVTQMEGEVT